MRYTAKYAHLESLPDLKVGQIIKRGDKIGRMGNTGSSTANHLHRDLIYGFRSKIWRLSEIEIGEDHARQSATFLNKYLFGIKPHITSYYCDPNYKNSKGIWIYHPGYDVVPIDRHKKDGEKKLLKEHFDIFWSEDQPGQVLFSGQDFDDITKGYGYTALVGFDAWKLTQLDLP